MEKWNSSQTDTYLSISVNSMFKKKKLKLNNCESADNLQSDRLTLVSSEVKVQKQS